VPYAEQLAAKREELAGAMQPLATDAGVITAPVGSERLRGYRNQARLVFRRMSVRPRCPEQDGAAREAH
jgi:tRNA/tmRNA/rRNA uracil-C5-methylase (TrmA/RlmC/RlmD family)